VPCGVGQGRTGAASHVAPSCGTSFRAQALLSKLELWSPARVRTVHGGAPIAFSAELLYGGASDVLFFDRVGVAVDGGNERGVRDPQGGPQIARGARPIHLREQFDRGSRERGVASQVRGELSAPVEDPPELAADDAGHRNQALERSVVAPGSLKGFHLEVFVVDGDDHSSMQFDERPQHRSEERADKLVAWAAAARAAREAVGGRRR